MSISFFRLYGNKWLQGFGKRVIIGTAMSLFFESMMAYTLSKKYYPFRTAITVLIAFTMWFNAGLIPFYLTVKTGLTNRFMSLVIPRLMSVWYIIIMRNFFAQIPDSLEESARIDGANDLTVLFRLCSPSTPVLATVALFHIVTYWNEWFHAMLFISDRKKQPVMIILRQILAQANQASLNENIRDNFDAPPTFTNSDGNNCCCSISHYYSIPVISEVFC